MENDSASKQRLPPIQLPRDSPSVTFTVDPHLRNIYNREQFGVVLVAAWPPKQSLTKPYETFIDQVKKCFDPCDLVVNQNQDQTLVDQIDNGAAHENEEQQQQETPNVYLYPAEHLHITVATFHPFNHSFNSQSDDDHGDNTSSATMKSDDYDLYVKSCQKITKRAMQRNEWPKHPFHVKVDRAQIGEKAGILLWRDCYCIENNGRGSFELIRNILREEYEKSLFDIPKGKKLIIPGIIHSTFLRFGGKPHTNGQLIQDRFQSLMNDSKLKEIFEDGIVIESMKLVVEKRAYMHVPCDKHHVFESCDLSLRDEN